MISDLGSNIKKIREEKGWSLNKLKQESGIGYATLHDIENGKSQSLNSSSLEKVANALNVDVNELLGIEIIEVNVQDLEKTLNLVLECDELEIDNMLVSDDEKAELKDFFQLAINKIRRNRNRNANNSNL